MRELVDVASTSRRRREDPQPVVARLKQRSVLVTGASSGIGRAAALGLAARGYRVFAGVRRERDAVALSAHNTGTLLPVMLDVTDEASIRSARKTIEESLAGVPLDALVNNAGIAVGGPLECTPLDAVRRQFEVNVLGMLAVFQAFAPSLRAARGRIVNIGSMAGFFSPSFQGPYCASKHALEALNDSMRRELQPFGVRVVLLEPGSVDTQIVSKATEEMRGLLVRLPEQARMVYGRATEQALQSALKNAARSAPPDLVVRLITRALESKRPRARYLAGADARIIKLAAWALPDRGLDWLLSKVT